MDSKSSNCEIAQYDFVLQNHTWKTCGDVWSSYIHSLFVIRVIFFASREYWTYKIGEGDTVLELILITNFLIKSQCAGRAHKSGSLSIQSPRIMKVTDSIKKVEVIENKTNQIWGFGVTVDRKWGMLVWKELFGHNLFWFPVFLFIKTLLPRWLGQKQKFHSLSTQFAVTLKKDFTSQKEKNVLREGAKKKLVYFRNIS